ncbi:MAG: hypothetical protein EZS28_005735 [Streblomastix strix]|uniref:Cation-transporting P-type ATPase C-terminal domain-containing protein n=1 Tax=Streblomastix strix TaxID=222440 RepID=A0A5J4WV20_9EUKA|nr:MAG: hypothetical protein EZS28_005735 [Streblomastix strix]
MALGRTSTVCITDAGMPIAEPVPIVMSINVPLSQQEGLIEREKDIHNELNEGNDESVGSEREMNEDTKISFSDSFPQNVTNIGLNNNKQENIRNIELNNGIDSKCADETLFAVPYMKEYQLFQKNVTSQLNNLPFTPSIFMLSSPQLSPSQTLSSSVIDNPTSPSNSPSFSIPWGFSRLMAFKDKDWKKSSLQPLGMCSFLLALNHPSIAYDPLSDALLSANTAIGFDAEIQQRYVPLFSITTTIPEIMTADSCQRKIWITKSQENQLDAKEQKIQDPRHSKQDLTKLFDNSNEIKLSKRGGGTTKVCVNRVKEHNNTGFIFSLLVAEKNMEQESENNENSSQSELNSINSEIRKLQHRQKGEKEKRKKMERYKVKDNIKKMINSKDFKKRKQPSRGNDEGNDDNNDSSNERSESTDESDSQSDSSLPLDTPSHPQQDIFHLFSCGTPRAILNNCTEYFNGEQQLSLNQHLREEILSNLEQQIKDSGLGAIAFSLTPLAEKFKSAFMKSRQEKREEQKVNDDWEIMKERERRKIREIEKEKEKEQEKEQENELERKKSFRERLIRKKKEKEKDKDRIKLNDSNFELKRKGTQNIWWREDIIHRQLEDIIADDENDIQETSGDNVSPRSNFKANQSQQNKQESSSQPELCLLPSVCIDIPSSINSPFIVNGKKDHKSSMRNVILACRDREARSESIRFCQSGQIFLGFIIVKLAPIRSDVLCLAKRLEQAGIHLVLFCAANEGTTKYIGEDMKMDTDWNSCISLSSTFTTYNDYKSPASHNNNYISKSYDPLPLKPIEVSFRQSAPIAENFIASPDIAFSSNQFSLKPFDAKKRYSSFSDYSQLSQQQQQQNSFQQQPTLSKFFSYADFMLPSEFACEEDFETSLPRGIAALKRHMQYKDDVPLRVQLFCGCSPHTMKKMISIYTQFGITVCSLTASPIHNEQSHFKLCFDDKWPLQLVPTRNPYTLQPTSKVTDINEGDKKEKEFGDSKTIENSRNIEIKSILPRIEYFRALSRFPLSRSIIGNRVEFGGFGRFGTSAVLSVPPMKFEESTFSSSSANPPETSLELNVRGMRWERLIHVFTIAKSICRNTEQVFRFSSRYALFLVILNALPQLIGLPPLITPLQTAIHTAISIPLISIALLFTPVYEEQWKELSDRQLPEKIPDISPFPKAALSRASAISLQNILPYSPPVRNQSMDIPAEGPNNFLDFGLYAKSPFYPRGIRFTQKCFPFCYMSPYALLSFMFFIVPTTIILIFIHWSICRSSFQSDTLRAPLFFNHMIINDSYVPTIKDLDVWGSTVSISQSICSFLFSVYVAIHSACFVFPTKSFFSIVPFRNKLWVVTCICHLIFQMVVSLLTCILTSVIFPTNPLPEQTNAQFHFIFPGWSIAIAVIWVIVCLVLDVATQKYREQYFIKNQMLRLIDFQTKLGIMSPDL